MTPNSNKYLATHTMICISTELRIADRFRYGSLGFP